MRRDFHFYGVYAILIHGGMVPSVAQIIAYGSEQVDDAKDGDNLTLSGHGQFSPLVTAYNVTDPALYTNEKALSTYAPFHFFPCLKGSDKTFEAKMVTRVDSEGIRRLKKELLHMAPAPFGPHYLGIGLHIIADSFAHQNFTAVESPYNRVDDLDIESSALLDIVLPVAGKLMPAIAHLQATTCPDEPACRWSYVNDFGDKVTADNPQRYLRAAQYIYSFVVGDLLARRPDWFVDPSLPRLPFSPLAAKLRPMFCLNMLLKDRIFAWQRAYECNYFDCPPPEFYDPRAWRDQAVAGKRALPNFIGSDFHLFHRALAHHLFFCRYDLFPEFGIYI